MDPEKKLRVAIVGGRIGGLALAVSLSKRELNDRITVGIYESTSKLAQVGAGTTMWPRAWEIIQNMGLDDSLIAKLVSPGREKPTKDKQRNIDPLDLYISTSGRVLLLGDANFQAHATSSDFANGAGLGIESTYVLGEIISKVTDSSSGDATVSTIAKTYDKIRRPFCNAAAAASRTMGSRCQFNAPGLEQYIDGQEIPTKKISELASLIEKGWEWATSSVMPDLLSGRLR